MSVCTCVWIKREYRLARFDQYVNWFYGLSILLTDHPELRRTTQPAIMVGPLGHPGFCFFRSTGNIFDDKSILVQVIVWYHQATSHYLRQCWSRSMSPYGVTKPHWVQACHFFIQQIGVKTKWASILQTSSYAFFVWISLLCWFSFHWSLRLIDYM